MPIAAVPTGHVDAHVEAPALLKEDAEHAVQFVARPPRLNWPAAQGKHACPKRKVPAGHAVRAHDVEPAVLKKPEGHEVHTAGMPPAPYCPAGQMVHAALVALPE